MTAPIVMLFLLAACDEPVAPVSVENSIDASLAPEPYEQTCGQDGLLFVELYGGIRATIDWRESDLSCTGMPRPNSEGARLRMAGPLGSGEEIRTIAFILGLPELEVGQTGAELETTVTIIEEGSGRFFSTQDSGGCWTDVSAQDPIGAAEERLYQIEGTLYCIGPLAELNGNASVTFNELQFTGRLNWEQPE